MTEKHQTALACGIVSLFGILTAVLRILVSILSISVQRGFAILATALASEVLSSRSDIVMSVGFYYPILPRKFNGVIL